MPSSVAALSTYKCDKQKDPSTPDLHVSQVSASSSHSNHPEAHFHLTTADQDQAHHVPVEAIADTGAQSNVWGLDDF